MSARTITKKNPLCIPCVGMSPLSGASRGFTWAFCCMSRAISALVSNSLCCLKQPCFSVREAAADLCGLPSPLLQTASVCHGALLGTRSGGDGQRRAATAFSSGKLGRALCHPLIWLQSTQTLSSPPQKSAGSLTAKLPSPTQ